MESDFFKLARVDLSLPDHESAQQLKNAFSQVGFCLLTNHGIPRQTLIDLLEANAQFHETLTLDEKLQLRTPYHRGYIPINSSTLYTSTIANVTFPNQSESFFISPAGEMGTLRDHVPLLIAGHNNWPDEKRVPRFKRKVLNYMEEVTRLGHRLVSILSLALGLPKDSLASNFTHPTSRLRLIGYPPHPLDAPSNLYGTAPHCDYGIITILLQDEVGGLQIQKDGKWFDVVPEEGTLVLNSGDLLHRLSNGEFLATAHCVKNKSHTTRRYSSALFFDVNFETIISPVVREGQTKKFGETSYGDYVMERLQKNYMRTKL